MSENQVVLVTQAQEETFSFITFISQAVSILWDTQFEKLMEFSKETISGFVLSGECPHCRREVALESVGIPHTEGAAGEGLRRASACKCVSCHRFVLGIIRQRLIGSNWQWQYEAHYPIGFPDDTVSDDVPAAVKEDFKEALRCRWVKAFKATVLMCRRALQTSCDMEQADGKDLFTQIDDLASKGRITNPLKEMAHRIRLLGKKGAHGDFSDLDDTIGREDADDAIRFMTHYLEHVYILPAKLK